MINLSSLFASAPSARTDLAKMDITPIDFVYLHYKMKSGHKFNFTEEQLQLALTRYLNKTKGPWTREQIKDVGGYLKLSENYIRKEQAAFEKLPPEKRGKPPLEIGKEQKELLDKIGVSPEQQDKKEVGMLKVANAGMDVFQLIATSEPSMAVALGILAMSVATNKLAEVLMAITDNLTSRKHSDQSVSLLTNFINKVKADNPHEIYHVQNDLKKAQRDNSDISQSREINDVKKDTHEKTAQDKKLEFYENSGFTRIPKQEQHATTSMLPKAYSPFEMALKPSSRWFDGTEEDEDTHKNSA